MPAVVGPESTSHLYLILLTMEGVYFLENIIYNDTLYVENWMPSIWHEQSSFFTMSGYVTSNYAI